ncbi:M48 metallopeptidase family protein [Corynebacterium sphenisci]|uniref:M48 metallopeptidase family protein n=1 Tax=Corynebacterium sphenisci TaxID=191493 RepID=UPI0026DF2D1C|nr:SprT-like domain-containing protein [Corynebacterium sphenisci]MDO5730605.1 SprT-like domain-containing protein [Corynebacterium sphenisci]
MERRRPDYGPDVEVRRSRRRRRTYQARAEGGKVVVLAPADIDPAQERREITALVERVRGRTANRLDDAALERRARRLAAEVLDGRPEFESIRWVRNMTRRWGSVSLGPNRIRISHRLAEVPDYVLDDVIVHELAHTFVEGGHGPEFWAWASRAPQHERARGYLEAYQRWGGIGG